MTPRLLLPVLLLLALPATAQLPTSELSASLGLWSSDEYGNGLAVGASYNRYWTKLLSTRAGGFIAREHDVTAGALHVSGELHLFRDTRISPWIGAGAAVAYTRRAASNDHFTGSETDLAPIVSAGVDVALWPRVSLGAEVSRMSYEVELGNRRTIDPVTIMIAARWKL